MHAVHARGGRAARSMHAFLFATFVALGLKLDVLCKDRPTAGLGCISRAYGNERAETIRFVELNENNGRGCADCKACAQISKNRRAWDAHSCWMKGVMGPKSQKVRERYERGAAALVADAATMPANVRPFFFCLAQPPCPTSLIRAAPAKSQASNFNQAISSQAPASQAVPQAQALNEGDDPLQGCAACRACRQLAERSHASDPHSCWKKGLKGLQVRNELERRQRCAALVAAEAAPPANVRLWACRSPRAPRA